MPWIAASASEKRRHAREKSGCLTCDEKRPTCAACETKDRGCEWPAVTPGKKRRAKSRNVVTKRLESASWKEKETVKSPKKQKKWRDD